MIYLLLAAWIWLTKLLSFNQISRNNQVRQEAQAAYQAGQYDRAELLYGYLSTKTTDPAVWLNLGHAYFKLNQYAKAKRQYERLTQSDRADLRTTAATQLGVIACLAGDSVTALSLFRQALLENTNNESARYNFELVKTYYSGKPPTKANQKKRADSSSQPADNPRSMNGQQVDRSDSHDELLRRFQRLNLSEAQALQLLAAMRTDDLPYALTKAAQSSRHQSARTTSRW